MTTHNTIAACSCPPHNLRVRWRRDWLNHNHCDNHAAPGRGGTDFERALLGEIARAHPWHKKPKADSPAILVARRLKSLARQKNPYGGRSRPLYRPPPPRSIQCGIRCSQGQAVIRSALFDRLGLDVKLPFAELL